MRGERRSGLTAREREVLHLVRVGLTNEEIAARLGVSPDTAKFHVSQILARLGVATREEAAMLAAPDERAWWHRLGAWGLAAKLALAAGTATAVGGIGLLAWGVASTGSGDSSDILVPTTTPVSGLQPTPSPLSSLPVPWVNSTPAPGPTAEPFPTPDPAVLAVPPCRAGQLQGASTGSNFDGGYSFAGFVIANMSSEQCRLTGEPSSVEYLDANGQVLFSGWQPECTPTSCATSIAVLEPNGALPPSSPDEPESASRAIFMIRGLEPAPSSCVGDSVVQSIALGLPSDGGTLTIPTPDIGVCLGTFVGQFVPEVQGVSPPTAPAITLITAIQMPEKATAGQELNYTAELINVSDSPFSFGDPCPNYILIIGNKSVYDAHSLNCRPVQTIDPGQHVLFAMKVKIPADLALGTYDVSWTLDAPYALGDTTSVSGLGVIAP